MRKTAIQLRFDILQAAVERGRARAQELVVEDNEIFQGTISRSISEGIAGVEVSQRTISRFLASDGDSTLGTCLGIFAALPCANSAFLSGLVEEKITPSKKAAFQRVAKRLARVLDVEEALLLCNTLEDLHALGALPASFKELRRDARLVRSVLADQKL